ncbi:MAG: bifunctional UDP-N-acetylglucosamine diphosphorylase/glucosamine-1-phosphate N-acetyltransferase GlmU [Dehalococcoidia bacterium]
MTASPQLAIVLAAGHGTRMRSRLPKVAHPLAGRPVVRHVVDAARAAGVQDVVVVVGAGAEADVVRAAAGDDVRFAVQGEALGTGHAVESARDAAGAAESVLIMNGDVPLVLPETLRRLLGALADADLALLTAQVPVEQYGVLEMAGDRIVSVIETKAVEGVDRDEPRFINSGQYAVRADWLWSHLSRITAAPNGERYLTALASMAHAEGNAGIAVIADDPAEVRGINDRVQLAEAEATLRGRIRRTHMLAGVTLLDPPSTFIDAGVTIGADTVLGANTHIVGQTAVGTDCVLGPGAHVRDSVIGDDCTVRESMIEESTLERHVDVGPYSHLRPGSHICEDAHVGNYAEVKHTRLGKRTKMGHHSYIGDAEVGDDVNIGAGTITANYDGERKHRTIIGDGAFIGSDTMLVAPVRIGKGARTSAGSVVTRDVPDGMMAIGAPARIRAIGQEQEESDSGQR